VKRPNNKVYRKITFKTDPKVCFRMPEEIHNDLLIWAELNARTRSEEIIARLVVTLQHNEEFMTRDRLMRLIYSKKLAHKGDKKA
jgi:hypothetical protein